MSDGAKYQVSQIEEVTASQPAQERKRSVEELALDVVKLIKTSSVIEFGCIGIGNVLGVRGGKTFGHKGCLFDHKQKSLVEEDDKMRDVEIAFDAYEDKPYQKRQGHFSKEGKLYIFCRIPYIWRSGEGASNPYISENSGGVHLTLALRFKKEELLNMEDKEIVEEFLKQGMDFYDRALNACAKEFIPDYYQNLKNLATKAGKKL